jgi:hypothetical protein
MTSHLTNLLRSPHPKISTVITYTLGPFLALGSALKLIVWKAAHEQYKRDGYFNAVYYTTQQLSLNSLEA